MSEPRMAGRIAVVKDCRAGSTVEGRAAVVGVAWLTALLVSLVVIAGLATDAHAAKQIDSAFGTLSGNPALGGTFNDPGGVAVRHSTGQIYVYDNDNFRIQRFSAAGDFERAWGWDVIQPGGSGDTGTGFEICTDESDCKAGVAGTGGGQLTGPQSPGGLALDQDTGAVYTTDARNRRAQKFDADGNFLRAWGRDVVDTGPGNADERQRLTVDATAGAYTLTFNGQTTGALAFNATPATVQAALEGLSNLAPGDVVVTGGPGGAGGGSPYIVQFAGTQANANLPAMTATNVSLSGGGGTVDVATLLDGASGYEICVLADDDVCQGNFTGALGGEFAASANTIAVDTAGDVYIGEGTNRRIQKFDSNGVLLRTWGWDVVASGPGNVGAGNEQQLIAVDATGGTFTVTFDGNTTAPIRSEANGDEVELALTALPRGSDPFGAPNFEVTGSAGGPWTVSFVGVGELERTDFPQMTADPGGLTGGAGTAAISTLANGSSYEVCVPANGDICQQAARGSVELGKFTVIPDSYLYLATDSANRVYASDPSAGRVQRFNTDGSAPEIFGASELSSPSATASTRHLAFDLNDATEPGVDHLYAVKRASPGGELQVKEILPDGTLAPDGLHAEGAGITGADGLAVDDGGSQLYLTSTQERHWVLVLDDDGGLVNPVVELEAATNIGLDSATLNGTINPTGFETSYRFEVSLDGSDWTPVGAFQSIGGGNSNVPVSAPVSGLQPNAEYFMRLVAKTVFVGTVIDSEIDPGEPATFHTLIPPGPTVTTGAAQAIGAHSAQVRGRINPNNSSTTYHVEYGKTDSYGLTTPVADAGSGGIERSFVVPLSDLDPNTVYHYRFVASNDLAPDPVEGADRTFTTGPVVPPCDDPADEPCRAYEMVTPPDKSGRVGGQDTRVNSPLAGIPSADGESFLAVTKWFLMDADAGGSIAHSFNPLFIERDPAGWKGKALNNILPQEPSVAGLTNPAGASSDLTVQAWQHNEWFFESTSSLGTRIFGDNGGTIPGSGWYDWLGNPAAKAVGAIEADAALLTENGDEMVRWGGVASTYRGLLGATPAEDPSVTQLAGLDGGDALYRQKPAATGTVDLVNECTGAGGAATQIPMVDSNGTPANAADDEISAQTCEAGAVTNARGAATGGGYPGPSGSPVAGPLHRALSEDGNRVIFTSPDPHATNLPTSCGTTTGIATDCPPQIYVRQYASNGIPTVRWISRSEIAGQVPALFGRGAGYEGASADGRFVYFKTDAPLTADDPNGSGTPGPKTTGTASNASWDLYRYELPGGNDVDPAGGTLLRISGGPDGSDGDSIPGDFDPNVLNADSATTSAAGALRFVSDDGERAYFTTRGIIGSPGDAWNESPDGGTTAATGSGLTTERNLYMFDGTKVGNERWKFIARIPYSPSGINGCASHASRSGMPQNAFDDLAPVHPSIPSIGRSNAACVHGVPNGQGIAFETQGQLTEDDEDDAGDVYVYDAATDELTRVSAPPSDDSGYMCDATGNDRCNASLGRTLLFVNDHERFGLNGAQNQNLATGPGGALSVFFESRVPLVAEDVNGSQMDVYRWRGGELSLISPGASADGAHFSGNTVDGEDVFFATSEAIDPREIDADFDIYDARVGGGIPLPTDTGPPCDALGDDCQPAGGGQPVDGSGETDKPGGGGDAQPPARVSLSVARPGSRALRRTARTGVLKVKVRASAAGVVRIAAKARIGKRWRAAGTTTKRLTRAGSTTLRLRLSRKARARLKKDGAIGLRITVRMPEARSRSLTLRVKRGRR